MVVDNREAVMAKVTQLPFGLEWLWGFDDYPRYCRFYGLACGTFMIGMAVALREPDGSMRKGL